MFYGVVRVRWRWCESGWRGFAPGGTDPRIPVIRLVLGLLGGGSHWVSTVGDLDRAPSLGARRCEKGRMVLILAHGTPSHLAFP